jgi:hypothetical protein
MAVAMRDSGRIVEAMQEETSDANEKSVLMLGEISCYAELGGVAEASAFSRDFGRWRQTTWKRAFT